jgi:response regulator RpfG family c-di-GMP phosphodiesterase
MNERILFVDDEPDVLATFQRNLRKQFQIVTASSGPDGLAAIDRQGPFAVIVSDLRMPGMDGTQFLAQTRVLSPYSVLMMFTGYVDVQTAYEAVNDGTVFRFLIKPCQLDTLTGALEASIAQYRLRTAEREVLEQTLKGSVGVLTEILGMVNPAAFGRATRVKDYVKDIAVKLNMTNMWQLEVAAMLSQIGCVSVPAEVLDKAYAGQALTPDEQDLLASHPAVGSKLIANIPRFESIAWMIEAQQMPYRAYNVQRPVPLDDEVALGAQILKVANDLDQMVVSGLTPSAALNELRQRPEEYNPRVVKALRLAKGMTASLLQD